MFASLLLLLPALAVALALTSPVTSPFPSAVDTSTHCGQWDTVTTGSYTLFLDQWGASGATSGSHIAWTTNWTWTGGNGVKSFTNVQQNSGVGKTLAQIKSMPVWSYSTSGTIVSDVAYDIFTASTPTGDNVNEIMIWLANYNAGPISSAYNNDGTPKPAASNINLDWAHLVRDGEDRQSNMLTESLDRDLFTGSNGANNVFSFLPTSGSITNFNGDVNTFFQYLTKNQGVSTSQYLKTAQAGTEPTSGKGTLTTSSFSLVIN